MQSNATLPPDAANDLSGAILEQLAWLADRDPEAAARIVEEWLDDLALEGQTPEMPSVPASC